MGDRFFVILGARRENELSATPPRGKRHRHSPVTTSLALPGPAALGSDRVGTNRSPTRIPERDGERVVTGPLPRVCVGLRLCSGSETTVVEMMWKPTAHGRATRESGTPRSRRAVSRRRRWVRRVSVLVVVAAVTVPVWSFANAALASNGDPFSVNATQWARGHYLSWLVDRVEHSWYAHHQPSKGGSPSGGIARVGARARRYEHCAEP